MKSLTRKFQVKEVKAKSIIQKSGLPGSDYVINPYIGCIHGCIYCLDGDTLILMHDGTTKRLKDLKVGDKVYGVRKNENTGYYYYEITKVLAHWKIVKPAFKIITDEGIEVICSPDHRWLSSSRGWKYTFGRMAGRLRRPYLTKNNAIQGVGKLITSPEESNLYMRGYLSGIIRGDGLLKSYDYSGRRRNKDIQYQFRLALDDKEAVIRAYNYLDKLGIKTNWFKFKFSNNPVDAIRINSKESYQKIKKLINFNSKPEYLRGFAAGIFDAEGGGGSDSSTIRIFNTDTPLLEFVRKSLKIFGFHVVDDKPNKNTNCKTIRIRGDLEEYMRFFQTMNPAIKRKIVLEGKQVKRSFRVKEIVDLHEIREMYDITTGTGTFIANGLVSHNCYARFMKRFTGHREPWGRFLDVKINAADLIPRNTRKYQGKSIGISSVTDPYLPVERKYKLMRGILKNLIPLEPNLWILTKSDLITRDVDLLKHFKNCIAGVSLSLLDDKIRKKVEPFACSAERRIKAVERLKKAGIRTAIFISPIFPILTDWKKIIEKTKNFTDEYWFENLNLYPSISANIKNWIKSFHPQLQETYSKIFFKDKSTKNDYWKEVEKEISNYCKANRLKFSIYFHHQKT